MTAHTPRRLLIVEDDALIAGEIHRHVSKLGYEVAAMVDNGEEAVKQAFALTPDLVLMDIVLRGALDGIEAARQIRAICSRPVVFVTGHFDATVLKRARECEPYGFVLKPFGERDLFVQIEMALYRHQLETERVQLRREMDIAHDHLRNLRGLLPICAGCKKICDEHGYWNKLEDYFSRYANIEFTHGFCPECETRLYGTQSRAPFVRPVIAPTAAVAAAKKSPQP